MLNVVVLYLEDAVLVYCNVGQMSSRWTRVSPSAAAVRASQLRLNLGAQMRICLLTSSATTCYLLLIRSACRCGEGCVTGTAFVVAFAIVFTWPC